MIKVSKTKLQTIKSFISLTRGHKTEDVLVADAELVLVPCSLDDEYKLILYRDDATSLAPENRQVVKAIVISSTEKIEVGDFVYLKHAGRIEKVLATDSLGVRTDFGIYVIEKVAKVLALPEHLSIEDQKDIIDGRTRPGNVLIECTIECGNERCNGRCSSRSDCYKPQHIIKLNSSKHVTLHKAEEKTVSISLLKKAFFAGMNYGNHESEVYWDQWLSENVKS